jgi:SPP1 family phage portal protein
VLTNDEIVKLINNDRASTAKVFAQTADRYYDGRHDIRKHRVFFLNDEGKPVEVTNRSNVRVSHPFFTELVDQKVQYTLSGHDAIVKSDNPELQPLLDEYFGDDFQAELMDVLTSASVHGRAYLYAFMNEEGRTEFHFASGMGVVEVTEKESSDGRAYTIYHVVDRVVDRKTVELVQVWDDKQTWFFRLIDNALTLDDSVRLNPRPHIVYEQDGVKYADVYGFIPFFRFDNNKKQTSDLAPIKGLIDDYDLMACSLSNDLQDFRQALYVVRGFEGDNMDELLQNINAKRAIGVTGDGGVDVQTVEIPIEARRTKLELDERNIYRFGMGLNTAGLKDTAATTNIAIKMAYTLLDLKCNKVEHNLRRYMKKLVKVALDEINAANNTGYSLRDVYFDFTRETTVNEQENAQTDLTTAQAEQTRINTLLSIASMLDNETIVKGICDVLDIDYDSISDKLPADPIDSNAASNALMNAPVETLTTDEPTETDNGGGDIE